MNWNILFKLHQNVFLIIVHHDLPSLEFFFISSWLLPLPLPSYLSTLTLGLPSTSSTPRPPDGSSLHAVVAAVRLRLNRTAQTATGKLWIESKWEEAQTDTHHKVAECPAWPKPHPLMGRLVEEWEATEFNKSSAQSIPPLPWSNFPRSTGVPSGMGQATWW